MHDPLDRGAARRRASWLRALSFGLVVLRRTRRRGTNPSDAPILTYGTPGHLTVASAPRRAARRRRSARSQSNDSAHSRQASDSRRPQRPARPAGVPAARTSSAGVSTSSPVTLVADRLGDTAGRPVGHRRRALQGGLDHGQSPALAHRRQQHHHGRRQDRVALVGVHPPAAARPGRRPRGPRRTAAARAPTSPSRSPAGGGRGGGGPARTTASTACSSRLCGTSRLSVHSTGAVTGRLSARPPLGAVRYDVHRTPRARRGRQVGGGRAGDGQEREGAVGADASAARSASRRRPRQPGVDHPPLLAVQVVHQRTRRAAPDQAGPERDAVDHLDDGVAARGPRPSVDEGSPRG